MNIQSKFYLKTFKNIKAIRLKNLDMWKKFI